MKVHDGFQDAQVRTADAVLKTVKDTLASSKFKRVLVTGTLSLTLVMIIGRLTFRTQVTPSAQLLLCLTV